jgi:hypothetical protein
MQAEFAGPDASPLTNALARLSALLWFDLFTSMARLQIMRRATDAEPPPPHPAPDFPRQLVTAQEHRVDRCQVRFQSAAKALGYLQSRSPGQGVKVRARARSRNGEAAARVEVELGGAGLDPGDGPS